MHILKPREYPGEPAVAATQRQFMPAALELQESPPSPAGHWLTWTLVGLFTIGVLWACFGHVDIVVSAPGRIVPSGQVKVVQAPETGTVLAIHIKEGEYVQAGQLLVSLDPTYAEADDVRISRQIADVSLELSWRAALDNWLAEKGVDDLRDGEPDSKWILADPAASALFDQNRAEISARLQALGRERDSTRAELAVVVAEGERVDVTLPILGDRLGAYQELYDKQFGARVTYLEMLQQYTELERSVPILDAREQQLSQQLAAFDARLRATREEYRTRNLLQITHLNGERASLSQDGKKANQRKRQQELYAPVTGTVQQLAIHTVGGVVTPAQELMKIVPDEAALQAEVTLQNKDIGFVMEGQPAEVKIDAFNFTRYGVIEAEVSGIGEDAVADEQLGWVFPMRLQLKLDTIDVEGRAVRLSPGMSITAEIKTGQRRLIEFFLSPLVRYRQESVRER
jgi:hemolysin D